MRTVLIIGGSAEALAMSHALPEARVRLVNPERVRRPWLEQPDLLSEADFLARPDAVIEVAHPSDTKTACLIAEACARHGLRHLQLVRPPWRPGRRDRWTRLRRPEDATRVIPPAARVLITLGRGELPRLKALRATKFVRRLGPDPDHDPINGLQILRGTGPFSITEEIAVMRRHHITWVLSYNAGGSGGWPKLGAARRLGLPVALIDRPQRPVGPCVSTVKEALRWLNT